MNQLRLFFDEMGDLFTERPSVFSNAVKGREAIEVAKCSL